MTSNNSKYCAYNFEQYALVPENLYATTLRFWMGLIPVIKIQNPNFKISEWVIEK